MSRKGTFSRCLFLLLGATLIASANNRAADVPPVRKTEPVPKSSAGSGKEAARPPAKSAEPASRPAERKAGTGAPPSLETLKLPSGAVIVICPDAKEALQLQPRAVVLTLDEYQRLLEQIDQLKRQNKSDKPVNPSICRVTGSVADELAQLQVQFDFRTERPLTLVNLGCRKGWPTDARLDGELAFLQEGEDGYVIPVEKPGAHKVKLEVRLPIVARRSAKGSGRGFDLDLPGAAISILDQLDLPGAATDVTVGLRSLKPKPVDGQRSRLETVPIVPASSTDAVQRLDVTWKNPSPEPAKGPTVLSATGKIIVHVDEAHVSTDADLELGVVRGETPQWRIRIPLPAEAIQEIKVQPQDERVLAIERSADKDGSLVVVRLKEASADALKLTLRLQQAQTGKPVRIGPFQVLDVLMQRGEIEIRSTDDLRLYYQKQNNVGQREVSDDQRRDNVRAVFQYWNMAAKTGEPAPPWVTVQAEAVKGAAEARVSHHLRLIQDEAGAAPKLQLTTRLEINPVRTAVDRIELSLPPDYEFERQPGASPSELVEEVSVDSKSRNMQVKLAHKQFKPFSVMLPGTYRLPEGAQEAALHLPRPLKWSFERGIQTEGQPAGTVHGSLLDRGGQVTIAFPEGLAASGSPGVQESGGAKVRDILPDGGRAQEYTWQAERMPVRLTLAWRPHRPELAVDTVFDLTPAGRQAHVRAQLDFHFAQAPPAQVQIHVPPGLLGEVRVLGGGVLETARAGKSRDLAITLSTPTEKMHSVALEYAFSLVPSAADGRFGVPLVRAARATRGGSKVRVWGNPADHYKISGGQWEELATEIVRERDSLPALVLHGGLETPLNLRRTEAAGSLLASVVIERALIRCVVSARGIQAYHARFRVSKLSSNTLDIELPGILANANAEVRLDDKQVPTRLVDETGTESDSGKILRLHLSPELYSKPAILDVRYQGEAGTQKKNTLFQTMLEPPVIARSILLGRVRWQIELPPEEIALYPAGGYAAEQRWSLWGWLLAPKPAQTNQQLEQWFSESEAPASLKERAPTLVCWQTALTPLVLIHAPERFWLLVCSLVLLGLGVGLIYVRLPRLLFWLCLLAIGGAMVAVGILWPGLLPSIVYGCEPGAAVLVFLVALQWTLHERYRRKVVFMPGFTRLKPGSSLVHAGSSNRKREVSTVDEPPKRGSSISKQPKP